MAKRGRPKKFKDRAQLSVYLERSVLRRLKQFRDQLGKFHRKELTYGDAIGALLAERKGVRDDADDEG